jgi:hypothetical protein
VKVELACLLGAAAGLLAILVALIPTRSAAPPATESAAGSEASSSSKPGTEPDDRRRWWLRTSLVLTSAILLAVALGLLVDTQKSLLGAPSRPRISTEWQQQSDSLTLKLTVRTESLAIGDQLYVNVIAPAFQPVLTFYWGVAGPASDGSAEQVAEVAVPTTIAGQAVDVVQVVAVARKRPTSAGQLLQSLSCEGTALSADPTGNLGTERVEAACQTIKGVPALPHTKP